MTRDIERQVPVMPQNVLANSYEQLRPTARGTVLPPQEREALEQYEEQWGPEDKGDVDPLSTPDESEVLVSPPSRMSSAPPPLGGFIAIDLVRMLVVGDNGEEIPIHTEEAKQSLKLFCRDAYMAELNKRLVTMSEALGVPLPKAPREEKPQPVQKKKTRKRASTKE